MFAYLFFKCKQHIDLKYDPLIFLAYLLKKEKKKRKKDIPFN